MKQVISALAIVALALASAIAAPAHAGQFERECFGEVNEPYYEPPIEQPTVEQEAPEEGQAEEEWTEPEWAEPYYEPSYYEACYEPAYEPTYAGTDLKSQGVVYDDGTRYTWYSENALPGGGLDELNANGRSVDGDGHVVDGDGYIAVASSDHEVGTVLETPWGTAKVYDTGCPSGTVDVYTSW